MALTKAEKKEIIEKVSEILTDSKSIVFALYNALTVAEISEMRRSFREAGVGFRVAKKTLTRMALDGKKIEGAVPLMSGPVALAYGADLIAPSREVFRAGKKYQNKISIMGGIFDGRYMSKDEMSALALIPPRETLLGMFVNVINSPIQGLVLALDAVAKKKV